MTVALVAGASIQALARFAHIPSIVVLLVAGAMLGPAGMGWVQPSTLGEGLFLLVDFAVAVILFEGALNLDLDRIRREELVIRRLVSVGALITLVGAALAARFWLSWSWPVAALFGSLIVVTGPTVVGPLVRSLRLRPRLQTVLEAEGVFIDPIGAVLAVLVLEAILATDRMQATAGMLDFTIRVVLGLATGIAGGFALTLLLRLTKLVRGLENILALAVVTLLFHLGEQIVGQSGLVAVTAAGVVVGNFENPALDDLREFKDQLTLLLIGTIFVLLAADVTLGDVRALGWNGIAVVLTLMFVVRPVTVWLATRGADLTTRERAFIAALAPRGIVAAAMASLVATTLDAQGIDGGAGLRALVFLVIAGTVVAAGAVAWPMSVALGVRLPARDRIAILGAKGLGLALGTVLRDHGAHVVFIDIDPQRCREAERLGFSVVYGDGLQERTLRRARMELVGTAIGATFDEHLNSQFAGYAKDAFDVPKGLVLVKGSADGGPEHVRRHGADVLFDSAHDPERWDVRWRQHEVSLEPFTFVGSPDDAAAEGIVRSDPEERIGRSDAFVILAIERNRSMLPMGRPIKLRVGDRAVMAIYSRARGEATGELASLGWQPLPGTATDTAFLKVPA